MISEPKPPDASDSANLVAFLDGELPEAEARALEAEVSRSQDARREVEALRGTWDLLDFLPRAKAAADFGPRTLSALRRSVDNDEGNGGPADRRHARLGIYAAATLLMACLGYAATRWSRPDPGARLADRLSIAEYLDDYRDVGSIEFLQSLDKSPEFDEAE